MHGGSPLRRSPPSPPGPSKLHNPNHLHWTSRQLSQGPPTLQYAIPPPITTTFTSPHDPPLHNHDNTHWGLSITLRKANHHHIIYLDSLNNRYPALEEDLTHFWTRSAKAAHALQLTSAKSPKVTMHHLHLPTQTNNYDCGIFVLAYQRATQLWLRTYLPS